MSVCGVENGASLPVALAESRDLPRISPWLRRWFVVYLRRYFARNFNAVRVSREGRVPTQSPSAGSEDSANTGGRARKTARPLIVYANHPSWWDPIHLLLVAAHELPGIDVYAPMDAEALARYPIFKRLGAFGIERGTRRGTVSFVRNGVAILSQPGASLWVTAEGCFTDPRPRPLRLRPGLAHLARRLEDACIVPLAVEYPFWNERRPEALTRFGDPIVLGEEPERSVDEWTALFERNLTRAMDALAEDSGSRDPSRFRTLVSGRAGVGGVYDGFRRLAALARGQRFDPAHEPERR